MLAILYLVAIVVVGDTLTRPILAAGGPFFPAPGRPRRLATAFLAGFLSLTWLTYLAAFLLRDQESPLSLAEAITLGVAGVVFVVRLGWAAARGGPRGGLRRARAAGGLLARPDRSEILDWVLVILVTIFAAWMMSRTYYITDGALNMSVLVWSDFGPTTAISQSFALGSNFPTEYPHFANFPMLYHFLYYFAVGDLTHLGFDPALANNVLSTATMVSLLVLVMAIGRLLFPSPALGRIGAVLFFVHGSLSWYAYVTSFASPVVALGDIWRKTGPLVSGFPYRGEEWGIWTLGTFLNQRHLAGAIGIVLVGVLFVVERQLVKRAERDALAGEGVSLPASDTGSGRIGPGTVGMASGVAIGTATAPESRPSRAGRAQAAGALLDRLAFAFQDRTSRPIHHVVAGLLDHHLLGYVLVGFLLGMLPIWNSAVFVAAATVFAVLFVLLPNRAQLVAVAVAAGSVALPQLLALRPLGLLAEGDYPAIHWGYTLENPTPEAVATYMAFTFGPKLLLALVALLGATVLQGILFVAFSALVGVAFGLQFSPEAFANHKFLNIWLIVLNLFAAAGMVRLWIAGGSRLTGIAGVTANWVARGMVLALAAVIAVGGLIDLMPIKNAGAVSIRLQGDRLYDWLLAETKPDAVFLTDLYVTHPILLAGRKIYYGWPYYAWSAGYPLAPREQAYKEIMGGTDPAEVVRLLQREGIDYVAIDDAMRTRDFVRFLNERLFAATLEPAFTDTESRHGRLVIYRVPPGLLPGGGTGPPSPTAPRLMFEGGAGAAPGQFNGPRGIAVAPSGEVLVADSGNHRIQRFGPDGTWRGSFGGQGTQPGRFNAPNGVAVGPDGRVYVADTTNHRLQEFDASLRFVAEWKGPATPFYGPRDVVVARDGVVHVLDQGRARVVSRAPNGTVREFGTFGGGDGQLAGPTGLAVTADRIYVADADNDRIVVFDLAGRQVATWPVVDWQGNGANYPDIVLAEDGRRLYVSSTVTDKVLVFDLNGRQVGVLASGDQNGLSGPAALAVKPGGGLYVVNHNSARITLLPTFN